MKELLVLVLLCVPQVVFGSVVISEVAWMGTVSSANDEWIELQNTSGSAVDVTGWKLVDGMNLTIVLGGTIPAASYVVLERTDDDTVPGAAFVVYTGALGNTGATLQLLRGDGSLEDQVAGGDNWGSIGGDNTTKETAQLTTSGWVTAVPTPGKANSTHTSGGGSGTATGSPSTGSSIQKDDGKNERIELRNPTTELSLTLEGPERAYVNQPVVYRVTGSGVGETIRNSLVYTWSFGDIESSIGAEVKHTYTHAGEYVVTVEGSYGRHNQAARKTVTVLPLQFSLARGLFGEILLHNNAKYEVDVSLYTLRGSTSRTFPKNTLMLPGATLTLHKNIVGTAPVPITLHDQTGLRIARLGDAPVMGESTLQAATRVVTEFPEEEPVEQIQRPVIKQALAERNFSFESDVVEAEHVDSVDIVLEPEVKEVFTEKTPDTLRKIVPYALLCALLVGAVGALMYGGRKEESQLV